MTRLIDDNEQPNPGQAERPMQPFRDSAGWVPANAPGNKTYGDVVGLNGDPTQLTLRELSGLLTRATAPGPFGQFSPTLQVDAKFALANVAALVARLVQRVEALEARSVVPVSASRKA